MSVAFPIQSSSVARCGGPPWRVVILLWLLAGLGLGLALGRQPVQRTQEARVLETARQMRGTGWRGWIVPKLNGLLRLKKPPLAYWMAALAYDVGGVSAGVARWPTVVCGWLGLGVTFAVASRLFGRRAGVISALCLLSSFLFFRHNRLAETDAPAALFVTIAIFAWWRAVDGTKVDDPSIPPSRLSVNQWFNLGAIATVLAILFKGGPGGFPPAFLVGLVALRGQWGALRRFVKSGAPLLIVALAAPWFVYARFSTSSSQIEKEVDNVLNGGDHYAPFYHYFPEILKAAAPWSLIMLAAIGAAIAPLMFGPEGILSQQDRARRLAIARRWGRTPEGGLVVWGLSIFLPLCVIGNKQYHYLLPLMPPMMILVGWLLDRSTKSARQQVFPAVGFLIDATLFGTCLAAPAVLLTARKVLGHVRAADIALAAALAVSAAALVVVYLWKGRPAAMWVYLLASVLLFPPAIGLWLPSMEMNDSVQIAREFARRYGKGPYVFYGPNYSLPLCFNLRQAIPSVQTPTELLGAAAHQPGLIVIAQTKTKHPPPMPPGFTEDATLNSAEQVIQIFRAPGVSPTSER